MGSQGQLVSGGYFFTRWFCLQPKLVQGRRFSKDVKSFMSLVFPISIQWANPSDFAWHQVKSSIVLFFTFVIKLKSLTASTYLKIFLVSSKSRWIVPILASPIFYDKFFPPHIWSLGEFLYFVRTILKRGPISLLFLF